MHSDQFEFVMAVEAYKKVNKKLYPTWTEILEVLRQLGYRKVMPRSHARERARSPAGKGRVRTVDQTQSLNRGLGLGNGRPADATALPEVATAIVVLERRRSRDRLVKRMLTGISTAW